MTTRRLRPLPIRVRAFDGETVTSYARRLAARNGLTVSDIDRWLHGRELLTSASARHPDRLEAYRQLGGLHASAFTTPAQLDGNLIGERRLCPGCSHGQVAWARLPRVGMICPKHHRWLGDSFADVTGWRAQESMERYFRRHLASRSVFVDSYAMRAGLEYAYLTVDEDLPSRFWTDWDVRLYDRQVRYAAILSDRTFLDVIADPRADQERCRAVIAKAAALPAPPSDPIWPVENRMITLSLRLRQQVAEALRCGMPVIDSEYNLLRLSSFSSRS